MKLAELFSMQAKLDRRIECAVGQNKIELLTRRAVAFRVELGELMNAHSEGFKFWKRQHSTDREDILEEYVDALHFALSLGISSENDQIEEIEPIASFAGIAAQAEILFTTGIPTIVNSYRRFFGLFLGLGRQMGFTDDEIVEAYKAKNTVNHERQESGY